MMPAFLGRPAAARTVYIDEAVARRAQAPVLVLEDFRACWPLSILFQSVISRRDRLQWWHIALR
jgi:hypothetical protein